MNADDFRDYILSLLFLCWGIVTRLLLVHEARNFAQLRATSLPPQFIISEMKAADLLPSIIGRGL